MSQFVSAFGWARLIVGDNNMLRRFVIVATVAFLAAFATPIQAQEADRPNILVIWGDDIGWSNLSSYGDAIMG